MECLRMSSHREEHPSPQFTDPRKYKQSVPVGLCEQMSVCFD
jgi:hypothetical protein